MKAGCIAVLALARLISAHGDHGTGMKPGENIKAYAQRHMASEHHIESFDLRSFFQLHDLNRDGFWDREEIEAIYGVHHVYNKKKSKDDEEHQKKADHISMTVMNLLDKDHDGKVSPEEFEAVGLDGLPNFEELDSGGHDFGHHYMVEDEFFLHHEEEFHSTPETQTDESYNHPEDLEHFAQHEAIERNEAEKEAKFQGITVEEALAQHEPPAEGERVAAQQDGTQHPESIPDYGAPAHPHDEQIIPQPPVAEPPADAMPGSGKPDPKERYRNAKAEQKAGARAAEANSIPKGDRTRKSGGYKAKFRRTWGDF
ncbi:Precursor to secretory protein [Mycena kentingensis (nom. inval.)]|nr:Precursor to secretory protein [Mycena kentingensis (nom. inval.)]